jgi:hypothetical protein
MTLLDEVARGWQTAMRKGDFEAAWRETDRIEVPRRQRQAEAGFLRERHHLLWNGDAFDGQRVLVRCNHGLGDTIQFARYVPLIASRASSTTLLVQPPLVDLFACCPDPAYGDVRNGWTDDPPPANEIEVMELPYAFRSTLATLPANATYLTLDPAHASVALPLATSHDNIHVGLVWASSDWDTSRSIPLDVLAPVAQGDRVRLYSLQQGRAAAEWRGASFPIENLAAHTTDIVTLAAAIVRLDLVIAVDCMVAHLAGALGQPVWVLLLHDADWRWMAARSDSPWYPTMRLFRQSGPGNWTDVVRRLSQALCGMRTAGGREVCHDHA